MQPTHKPYKKLVLVCTNCKEGEKCCSAGGSEPIRDALKAKVKALALPVRVSKTGCMGMCPTGPTVVIMPDDLWFGAVTMGDVDRIVDLLKESLASS
ncbi:MAG TPA: (2Fe-2S) ferredoxin domain-containing protein [Candidatus Binatia bacterium]|jgi:(2Fe-2S) ferredoxin|nr:(2Fe-2S) ferredoxin domain-containing protein [Candidatus Binatia bacterium]